PSEHELPQLFLLAVGISEFADKERNLDFAAKDAKEIVVAFEQSPAYSKVNKMLLTNKEATLANFEKQLAFLQKAKPGDVVIIYFSTHGVLDEKMDYYLATHDMAFANPQEKGISYYKLEELLSKLSCRNRMIIMDACHSGEVDKDEAALVTEKKDNPSSVTAKSGSFTVQPKMGLKNSFAYMHALFDDASRSTGTHIIGAASGYQVALESGEWNNGAFTYALKAGLSLKAADLDKDGSVQVSELQTYLCKTVPQLTNGEQTPALRSVNRDNDFRLW
ncbi:MAG: caspase domain-containing protein, partial [Flavobacteriales bacterium]